MVVNPAFWRGRRVFLTGHTGFKGGWLSLWLAELGAEVHGYALAPPTEPNLFTTAGVEKHLAASTLADIRDTATLERAISTGPPSCETDTLPRKSPPSTVTTFSTMPDTDMAMTT